MVKSVVVISPPGERPAIDADEGVLTPEPAPTEGWSHVIIQPGDDGPPLAGPDIGASLRSPVEIAARRRIADILRSVSDPPPPPPDIGASFTERVDSAVRYYLSGLADALSIEPDTGPHGRRYTFAQGLPPGVTEADARQSMTARTWITVGELDTLLREGSDMTMLILRRPDGG